MAYFYIALVAEVMACIASYFINASGNRKLAIIVFASGLILAGGTYFSKYENYPWTTQIFPFWQVDYSASPYNEGKYYAGWEKEYPQGKGHLTYNNFQDQKYIAINTEEGTYKAVSYDGEFNQGWREGYGVTEYEGGYRDEGEYFGRWEENKVVFRGTRYLENDSYSGYVELELVAESPILAHEFYLSDWVEY